MTVIAFGLVIAFAVALIVLVIVCTNQQKRSE